MPGWHCSPQGIINRKYVSAVILFFTLKKNKEFCLIYVLDVCQNYKIMWLSRFGTTLLDIYYCHTKKLTIVKFIKLNFYQNSKQNQLSGQMVQCLSKDWEIDGWVVEKPKKIGTQYSLSSEAQGYDWGSWTLKLGMFWSDDWKLGPIT